MSGLMQMLGAKTLAHSQVFKAHPEELFATFTDLIKHAAEQRRISEQAEVSQSDWLFLGPDKVGIGSKNLLLTHTSMKQICNIAHIRMRDLQRMTEETAKRVLNELWPRKSEKRKILWEKDELDGIDTLRSVNSAKYERLWDFEVLQEIEQHLITNGFEAARPTVPGTAYERVKALVRSDSAMFAAFFKNQASHGSGEFGGIRRGIMVYNGETGERSFGYTHFLFREVSSTMLFWGLDQYSGQQHKHFKNVRRTFKDFREFVAKYEKDLLEVEFEWISNARANSFAPLPAGSPYSQEQEAKSKLIRMFNFDDDTAEHIVQLALNPVEGDGSLSVWAFANALTSHAKELSTAEARIEWSEMGARVLELAFE